MSSPALGVRGIQQRVVRATSSRKLTYKTIGLREAHNKRRESFFTRRPSCNAHAVADQVHIHDLSGVECARILCIFDDKSQIRKT